MEIIAWSIQRDKNKVFLNYLRSEMCQKGLKLFNLPNLLTSANSICGALSIVMAFFGRLEISVLFLLMAMLFDFFDGFTARKMGISSPIGKDLDSLADMISFGLAPGILMFITIELQINGNLGAIYLKYHNLHFNSFQDLIGLCALSIPFFSLFRLAKFNNDTRQTDRFIGLPTPANALFFIFFPLLRGSSGTLHLDNMETPCLWLLNPWLMAAVCTILPLLMVSEIPLLSLKFKTFGWNENRFRYLLLGISLITILTLRIYAIPIVILLYLILSIFESLIPQKK